MCYCSECECHYLGMTDASRGTPPQRYAFLLGWCRLGLKIHPAAIKKFEPVHVSFHGTLAETAKSILQCQNPQQLPPNQIFTSPTIKYCDTSCYTKAEQLGFGLNSPSNVDRFLGHTISPELQNDTGVRRHRNSSKKERKQRCGHRQSAINHIDEVYKYQESSRHRRDLLCTSLLLKAVQVAVYGSDLL